MFCQYLRPENGQLTADGLATDGLYVYSFQGQFTLPVAFQGVSHHSWQTVGNVLNLVAGIIAGGLYGNIGEKGKPT